MRRDLERSHLIVLRSEATKQSRYLARGAKRR